MDHRSPWLLLFRIFWEWVLSKLFVESSRCKYLVLMRTCTSTKKRRGNFLIWKKRNTAPNFYSGGMSDFCEEWIVQELYVNISMVFVRNAILETYRHRICQHLHIDTGVQRRKLCTGTHCFSYSWLSDVVQGYILQIFGKLLNNWRDFGSAIIKENVRFWTIKFENVSSTLQASNDNKNLAEMLSENLNFSKMYRGFLRDTKAWENSTMEHPRKLQLTVKDTQILQMFLVYYAIVANTRMWTHLRQKGGGYEVYIPDPHIAPRAFQTVQKIKLIQQIL